MQKLVNSFLSKASIEPTFSEQCKENWFQGSTSCMTCKKDPHKYTADNDMDPLHPRTGDVPLFHQERLALPQLSATEEALIAKNCVIMQGYRLRGWATAFKGNVISFPQDINDICLNLPRARQI